MASEVQTQSTGSRPVQDLIGIAENVTTTADPAGLMRALAQASVMTLKNPAGVVAANARLAWGSVGALRATAERSIGRDRSGPIAISRSDKRFADPSFRDNPVYFLLAQEYLLFSQLVSELLDIADLDTKQESKAQFAAKFLIDAISPTNTLPGNPAAVKKAFETGGKSVVSGLRNMAHDIRHNGGWPSQVDATGSWSASTWPHAGQGGLSQRPHRADPVRAADREVHEVPLLFCPPWINKYYIMDLAPETQPDRVGGPARPHLFRDQLPQPGRVDARRRPSTTTCSTGPLEAVEVVREITGAPKVNTVSVCLGGTLTAIGLAYDAARATTRSTRPRSSTPTPTSPGPACSGTFTDETHGRRRSRSRWPRRATSTPSTMARTFDALRANDLIFGYVVSNWLIGEHAAGVRPAGVERRRHPDAGPDALAVPAVVLPEQRVRPGRVRDRRRAARPGRVDSRHLRGVGRRRPHRAVDVGLQDHAAARRRQPVRALHLGPHRRHRQPAQPQGQALDQRPTSRPTRRSGRRTRRAGQGTWWDDWTVWIAERGGEMVAPPGPAR